VSPRAEELADCAIDVEIEIDAVDDALPPPRPSGVTQVVDFRVLYEENVAFVWRNLRRLGVFPSDLEDRTQEVFLVAFRRIDSFEERGFGVRAWLFQILLRVASDARRHRRRHPEDATSDLEVHCPGHQADPCDLVERRQALEVLDRALDTIEVGRRAVLVLH